MFLSSLNKRGDAMRQPENAWGRFQAAFVCGDGDWVECVVIQKVGGVVLPRIIHFIEHC